MSMSADREARPVSARVRRLLHAPRTRRGWLLTAALGVVVAVGVAYGAFALAAGSGPAALTLGPGRGTTGTARLSHIAGTWTVGAGSVAGYRVHEKLAILPAPSEAVGRTSSVTGQATVVNSGTGHTVRTADLTVQVSTLTSDRPMRDRRVHTLGLQTDTYPTATFALAQPIALPPSILTGTTVHVTATGPLTLHGQTRTVSIPMTLRLSGSAFEAAGSISFPWSEFGMQPPNYGDFVRVDDTATMEFDLHLTRTAAA
jgi:polyisoprenoid-binding protein YceI